MKPIEIKITGRIDKSSSEICAEFLDTTRWSEFKGYAMLPGIKQAQFTVRTPELIGSKISVQNMDGSSHVEEIIEWDTARQIAMRFQEFSPPLRHFATHFIEVWEFRPFANGTMVTRRMTMYPKGVMGWLILLPISKLMRKAFAKHLADMS